MNSKFLNLSDRKVWRLVQILYTKFKPKILSFEANSEGLKFSNLSTNHTNVDESGDIFMEILKRPKKIVGKLQGCYLLF